MLNYQLSLAVSTVRGIIIFTPVPESNRSGRRNGVATDLINRPYNYGNVHR